jgi:DUF971 family protein
MTRSRPLEIRLKTAERALAISFDDGSEFLLTAEYLRVESPSAEVQGHTPSQKQTVPGCRNVAIREVEQVGHYAIRIHFDDGHDTGIYSWDYLFELGIEQEMRWPAYLKALEARGLSRDK